MHPDDQKTLLSFCLTFAAFFLLILGAGAYQISAVAHNLGRIADHLSVLSRK